MKSPQLYLADNDFNLDAALDEMVADLREAVVSEITQNMLNARDLTEEEQKVFDSWLSYESIKTGEKLDIGDGSVEAENP